MAADAPVPWVDAAAPDVGCVLPGEENVSFLFGVKGVSVAGFVLVQQRSPGWREDDGVLGRRDGFWYLNDFVLCDLWEDGLWWAYLC